MERSLVARRWQPLQEKRPPATHPHQRHTAINLTQYRIESEQCLAGEQMASARDAVGVTHCSASGWAVADRSSNLDAMLALVPAELVVTQILSAADLRQHHNVILRHRNGGRCQTTTPSR
jgi:hypothetical protein